MYDLLRVGLAAYLLLVALFGTADYVRLRWIIFLGVLVLVFIQAITKSLDTNTRKIFFALFVVIAVIFNPISPLYLYDRGTWQIIDIICAIILFLQPMIINSVDKPLDNTSTDRYDKYF